MSGCTGDSALQEVKAAEVSCQEAAGDITVTWVAVLKTLQEVKAAELSCQEAAGEITVTWVAVQETDSTGGKGC